MYRIIFYCQYCIFFLGNGSWVLLFYMKLLYQMEDNSEFLEKNIWLFNIIVDFYEYKDVVYINLKVVM